MKFKLITSKNKEWKETIKYAQNCSWKAGKSLAKKMIHHYFDDWQRVMIVKNNEQIIAFCTLTKEDGIEHVSYMPYIGYIFVDEKYRGHCISQKMINKAIDYAKELGFQRVYIVSDHDYLYEKYEFSICDHKENKHGKVEKIYQRKI